MEDRDRKWSQRRRSSTSRLLVLGLELVGEGELGRLLLQLGELVLVLGDLLEGGLDELALHVAHGHVELVDLEVAEDNLRRKRNWLNTTLSNLPYGPQL